MSQLATVRVILLLVVLACAVVGILCKAQSQQPQSQLEARLSASSAEERNAEAEEKHTEAMYWANEGNYTMALPLFRAAVRLAPDQALFLNDLGYRHVICLYFHGSF
jgi:Flp pilus assembly protein TadD